MSAREDFEKRSIPFEYIDVYRQQGALSQMLELNGGVREVPVIVEDGRVTIGFGGT